MFSFRHRRSLKDYLGGRQTVDVAWSLTIKGLNEIVYKTVTASGVGNLKMKNFRERKKWELGKFLLFGYYGLLLLSCG